MLAFLRSVGEVLPCRTCRAHYRRYVATHLAAGVAAPALLDRESLGRFVVDLHNDVNRRLHRPTMDYEAVHRMYESDADEHWITTVMCMALAAAGGVMAYHWVSRRSRAAR